MQFNVQGDAKNVQQSGGIQEFAYRANPSPSFPFLSCPIPFSPVYSRFPDSSFPDGHFPGNMFPRNTFPGWFSRTRRFPERQFTNSLMTINASLVKITECIMFKTNFEADNRNYF